MAISQLKHGAPPDREHNSDLADQVALMLRVIETEGEEAVRRMARQFDRWEGDILLSDEDRARAIARVPEV
jgi:sulfopropanediol 3-dehydrogenase